MNAHKKVEMITIWMLMLTWLLSSCAAGDLSQLSPVATFDGIQTIQNGGGEIWTKGNQVFVTWINGGGRGMTVFSQTATDPLGKWFYESMGQAFYTEDWEGTGATMLRVGGWTKTSLDKLPSWLRQALSVSGETFWLAASLFGVRWCSIVPPIMPKYSGGIQN